MILISVLMLGVVLFLPKLTQGMSPEELEELKKQRGSGDPMKELSKLLGGRGPGQG